MKHRACRGNRGHSIFELPIGLWLIFVGIFFPLLILGTLTYRSLLAQNAVRDSTVKASKASTFKEAKEIATAMYAEHLKNISGVTGTYKLQILIKPIGSGSPTVKDAKLAPSEVVPATNMYFVRGNVTAQIEPLVQFNLPGVKIPGLTEGFPVQTIQDVYFENPYGLTE